MRPRLEKPPWRCASLCNASLLRSQHTRRLHVDTRDRLSAFWTPTRAPRQAHAQGESGHDLLDRAGFVRQAHAGLFHILPLGLRVQDKIERLIDKHMRSIGASKVSLSSLSSHDLWRKSGRLQGRDAELFHLEDRKGAKYLLAPTHEEEITNIVAQAVHSYKDLPQRLYQISRKYRDEARPRQGLLRGREFVMKDLYTFDATEAEARQTYEEVRMAYVAFLDELRMPYLVAKADSGNMGGSLSHEFHFRSTQGEDTIIGCSNCDLSMNEELYVGQVSDTEVKGLPAKIWKAMSKDRKTVVNVHLPAGDFEPNIYAIRNVFPDADFSVGSGAFDLSTDKQRPEDMPTMDIYDPRVENKHTDSTQRICSPVLLTKARPGDPCPSCHSGQLKLLPAVEVGHTFHLGTRYSEPLAARVMNAENTKVAVSMGCYGIGVSRLIGAMASLLHDRKGLNWPLVVAPFGVVIVSTPGISSDGSAQVYDLFEDCGVDAVIDDRHRSVGWKLNDADLVGYPFVVVVGSDWSTPTKTVELQSKRLGVREKVSWQELPEKIVRYSAQL